MQHTEIRMRVMRHHEQQRHGVGAYLTNQHACDACLEEKCPSMTSSIKFRTIDKNAVPP